jgi:hypothetical protein
MRKRPVLTAIAETTKSVPVIALFLLAMAIPAKAGTPVDLPTGPMAESLDALRHHQPTNERVLEREDERYGRQNVTEQQRQEKLKVDQLYDDAMRLSAPVISDAPPKPGS